MLCHNTTTVVVQLFRMVELLECCNDETLLAPCPKKKGCRKKESSRILVDSR